LPGYFIGIVRSERVTAHLDDIGVAVFVELEIDRVLDDGLGGGAFDLEGGVDFELIHAGGDAGGVRGIGQWAGSEWQGEKDTERDAGA
jgi:hypothetical protein